MNGSKRPRSSLPLSPASALRSTIGAGGAGRAVNRLSAAGLQFLCEREAPGGVPVLTAYPDTGGVWTIGFGHIRGVKPGDVCTAEKAREWLWLEANEAEAAVGGFVKVPLNQNQYDALVSFVFNIGIQAFADSTMLKLLNQDRPELAALQFPRWNKDNGKVVDGLSNRRAFEKALFETPV